MKKRPRLASQTIQQAIVQAGLDSYKQGWNDGITAVMEAAYRAGLLKEGELWRFQGGELIKVTDLSEQGAQALASELTDEQHAFRFLQKDPSEQDEGK